MTTLVDHSGPFRVDQEFISSILGYFFWVWTWKLKIWVFRSLLLAINNWEKVQNSILTTEAYKKPMSNNQQLLRKPKIESQVRSLKSCIFSCLLVNIGGCSLLDLLKMLTLICVLLCSTSLVILQFRNVLIVQKCPSWY